MKTLLLSLALALGAGFAQAKNPALPETAETPIFRDHALDLETGLLGQVGHFTSIDYRLVPTQLSWRTPRWFGADFADGSSLVVRHRITGIGTWVAEGPESRYLGFSFSPAVEYWNAAQNFSVYLGSGGGFGWIDAQGVEGGQGQDFTLNWFGHAGIQMVLTETLSLRAGAMFQHMSNGGATHPNPGIDAVGITLGVSWRL